MKRLIALTLIASWAVVLADLHGAARVAAGLWIVLVAPGAALVPLVREVRGPALVPVAVGVSLATVALVTTAALVVGRLSWLGAVSAFTGLYILGVALQIYRALPETARTQLHVFRHEQS